MPLASSLFDYHLPERLIAQHPAARRDASRLLVVDRASRTWQHRLFTDLPSYLRAGDTLIRNNAAVLPARLRATRPTGGAVECLLLRPGTHTAPPNSWWCLVRPGKKLPVGARFSHGTDFTGEIVVKQDDGLNLVAFTTAGDEPIDDIARRLGEMPLPPYIAREGTAAERNEDVERYQTVYADRARTVAAAAPTAGLHFTPALFSALAHAGIGTAEVTLHVGLGTFKPIETEFIEDHPIHREVYEMPPATQRLLLDSTPAGRRIAIGTTSLRASEDFLAKYLPGTTPRAFEETFLTETNLFVFPPRTFRGIDALLTNFHQPRSTLLCLVSAFLAPGSTDGIALLHQIYADAIAKEYRFFSYGDAMLIL